MDMRVRPVLQPPAGTCFQIIEVLKLSATEEIVFYILEGPFYFALCLRSVGKAGDGLAPVMGDKRGKRGIEYRPAGLPAQNNGLFVVIQTLARRAVEVGKTIQVTADQGEEIPAWGEIDILSSGKSKDIRKNN